jgi:glycosyltransferase involved in cell wall biosynthesis
MKFSVLLPTRNGAKYLKTCIQSILNQSYDDMELIVFDNANTDGSGLIIESFSNDNRMKHYKSQTVVSVTENWNNALNKSSGDYVLMIGDDDYLLPGFFKKLELIIERNNEPDGITYNGYSFVYPGVIKDSKTSFYSDPHFQYEEYLDRERLLPNYFLKSIVESMFSFRPRVPLNALPHLWSRKVINRLEGDLFRAPYPDHFALNSLLLKAKSWVFSPEKLYIVGVTPKSYGTLVFDSQEQEKAKNYLGIDDNFPGKLPGNPLINNMHVWLELLKESYPDSLEKINISRSNYVKHQVYFWISQYRLKVISFGSLLKLFRRLSFVDMIKLISVLWDKKSLQSMRMLITKRKLSAVETFYYGPKPLKGINDAKELCDKVILM